MKIVTIKKQSSKLKVLGVEMPNAPYSNRWVQGKETTLHIKDDKMK